MADRDWLGDLRVKRADLDAFSEPLRSELVKVYQTEFLENKKVPEDVPFPRFWRRLEFLANNHLLKEPYRGQFDGLLKRGAREFGAIIEERKYGIYETLSKTLFTKDDLTLLPEMLARIWLDDILTKQYPLHWGKNHGVQIKRVYHLLFELKNERGHPNYDSSLDTFLEQDMREFARTLIDKNEDRSFWTCMKYAAIGALALTAWMSGVHHRVKPQDPAKIAAKEKASEEEKIKRKKDQEEKLQAQMYAVGSQLLGKLPYEQRTTLIAQTDTVIRNANGLEACLLQVTPEELKDKERCAALAKQMAVYHDNAGKALDEVFSIVGYRKTVREKDAKGFEQSYMDVHLATTQESIDSFAEKLHKLNPNSLAGARLVGQNYLGKTRKSYSGIRKELAKESITDDDLANLAILLRTAAQEQESFAAAFQRLMDRDKLATK